MTTTKEEERKKQHAARQKESRKRKLDELTTKNVLRETDEAIKREKK